LGACLILRLAIVCVVAALIGGGALRAQETPKPKPSIAELWETGCLWEVGENKDKVTQARKDLVAAGQEAINYALTRLGATDTLETRCLSTVFAGWKLDPKLADKAFEGLIANVGHAEATFRRNAADLLDQIDDKRAAPALLSQAQAEAQEGVRVAQLAPLSRWQNMEALPLLVAASSTKVERIRARCAVLLANYEQAAAVQRLIAMLNDPTYYVADAAQAALTTAAPGARRLCLAQLQSELELPVEKQRTGLLRRLLAVVATLAEKDTPTLILRALKHENAGVRGDAADALATWKLGAGRLDESPDVAAQIQQALKTETDPFAKAALTRAAERLTQTGKNG